MIRVLVTAAPMLLAASHALADATGPSLPAPGILALVGAGVVGAVILARCKR